MAKDIKLRQVAGNWDIDFSNGDFELTDSLDTAVYMSVFGEKRASASQVSEPTLRGGHFTNEFSDIEGYEVGSLLWLRTRQAKNTQINLGLIEDAVKDGLSWMIEDKIISETEASASKTNSQVTIEVDLKNKYNQESKYYNLFLNL